MLSRFGRGPLKTMLQFIRNEKNPFDGISKFTGILIVFYFIEQYAQCFKAS